MKMMAMRIVVMEAYETRFLTQLITAFVVLFVSVIILILLTLVGGGASREAFIGISMYLIFALIVIGLMLFCLKKMKEGPRKAATLAGNCTPEENRLTFPLELEFEYGRVTLLSHPEKRRSARNFQVLKREKSSSIEFPPEEFKLSAVIGRGFASFPAVRVLSKPYERAVILFMTSRGVVSGKKLLTATLTEGHVDVEIEGRGGRLIGRFYTPPGGRGRFEVTMSAPESPEVNVRIADSSMQGFEYPLLPEESTVIFCPYGNLDVDNILRTLGRTGAVMGHGQFLVRLQSPKPRARKILEYPIEVRLEEEENWEF